VALAAPSCRSLGIVLLLGRLKNEVSASVFHMGRVRPDHRSVWVGALYASKPNMSPGVSVEVTGYPSWGDAQTQASLLSSGRGANILVA